MQQQNSSSRFEATERSETGDTITILALAGQLDAHTAQEFERFLERIVRDEGKRQIVLDMERLEYISSAGLGVLMGLIEEVRTKEGDIKLARLPEKIFHVLDLLGFPLVFQIFSGVDEAEAAFNKI
jgi:anti-sigma B factor antagonist